ncbi:MAG: tetratricopeptide repeat protein [Planctomycetes bacterium]|nr:tetratricopeptide repeat protein [Planctomycetota bacterium]
MVSPTLSATRTATPTSHVPRAHDPQAHEPTTHEPTTHESRPTPTATITNTTTPAITNTTTPPDTAAGPTSPPPLDGPLALDLARAYSDHGREAEARSFLERALEADPEDLEALELLLALDPGRALPLLERRAASGDRTPLEILAGAYAEGGRTADAVRILVRLLSEQPMDPGLLARLAALDPAAAVAHAESLARSGLVEDDEGLGDLGDALAASDLRDAALAFYRRALGRDPSDREWLARVVDLSPAEGLRLVEDRLQEEPGDQALEDLAIRALAGAGRTAEAAERAERAWNADPSNLDALRRLAGLDPARALVHLQALGPEASPDDELLGDMADAFAAAGRTREAVDLYERAHALDPGDSEWREKLSRLAPDRLRD